MKIACAFLIVLYLTISIDCKSDKHNRLLVEAATETSNNNVTQESDISKETSQKIEAETPVSDSKTAETVVENKETIKTDNLDKKEEVKEQTTTEEVKKTEE